MKQPVFGLIIIGDEILSGRHQDLHFSKMIELLAQRGLSLSWANYIGDDRACIANAIRQSRQTQQIVFCCGGIGATPDDHTRHAAALAFEKPLMPHPLAIELIKARICEVAQTNIHETDFTTPPHAQRLKMGELPQDAGIIPNPYNKIPGFYLDTHYFLPGFPVMAWPMIEWVLEQFYARLFYCDEDAEYSLWVHDAAEADLTALMESIEKKFAGIKTFSLPHVGEDRYIELGVKGKNAENSQTAQHAFDELKKMVLALGYRVSNEMLRSKPTAA